MSLGVMAAWWIACLLWSSTFVFIRAGLSDIPPFTFAAARLVIALLVLAPLAVAEGTSLTLRNVRHIGTAGILLLGVNYAAVFWSAQFIPSGLVAILQCSTPVLALIFGWAVGIERVTAFKVASMIAGVSGVAIIFSAEAHTSGRAALLGAVAALGGSVCVATAYVWLKRHPHRASAITITALQSCAAMLVLAPLALMTEGVPQPMSWSPHAWGALLYLAICASVVAFSLNYWLLARMDASAMLMMGVAEVPIAVGLGAVIFDERLPPGTLTGAALIAMAITTQFLNARSPRSAPGRA